MLLGVALQPLPNAGKVLVPERVHHLGSHAACGDPLGDRNNNRLVAELRLTYVLEVLLRGELALREINQVRSGFAVRA